MIPDPSDPAWRFSNHWTRRLADGTWAKVSDRAGEHDDRLHTEHRLNLYLGRPVRLGHCDGRCVVRLPHFGEPPEALTEEMIDSLLRLPQAPPWLRGVSDLPDRIRQRVRLRLSEEDPVAGWCLSRVDSVDVGELAGHQLAHTDPHLSNWVEGDRPRLIDWESGVASCRELDLAGFAHAALVAGEEHLARAAIAAATNREALIAGWISKTATGLSWYRAMLLRTGELSPEARTQERLNLIEHGDRLIGL